MINLLEKSLINTNLKAILNYCFRVLIFLFLTRQFILEPISNIVIPIVGKLTQNMEGDNGFIYGLLILFFLPYYILPKICGLFKKLDNLNILLAIMVILIVDVVFSYSQALIVQLFPLKFSYGHNYHEFILIWFFFLYKFFNFLTKIFPTPFKQIGYVFSIELLKDIYKDVKKDIEENYLKQK